LNFGCKRRKKKLEGGAGRSAVKNTGGSWEREQGTQTTGAGEKAFVGDARGTREERTTDNDGYFFGD